MNGEGCTSTEAVFLQMTAQQEHSIMKCHPEGSGQAQKWPLRISGDLIRQSVKPRLDGALSNMV